MTLDRLQRCYPIHPELFDRLYSDWAALEKAFAEKTPIAGTVTAIVKGGLSVDVGVRAFLPASRSGARDAVEMEKLVGQEIRCRIEKPCRVVLTCVAVFMIL